MIDKYNTVILLDNNSTLGKVVRLIMDRNCDLRDGYDFHQHSKESTYFPGSDDKKFLLIGDGFHPKCLEDIKRKDPDFKRINFEENDLNNPLDVLSNLWYETSKGIPITLQEADVLQRVARIFEKDGLITPQVKLIKEYIDNIVNVISRGNEFFITNYSDFENTVKWLRDKNKVTSVEQDIEDTKKFFEPSTYQIVLDFKGKDLEEVLLDFYKKYPDLKEHFNLIKEMENDEDISSIMEQKILLESLHLANVEYYEKCIKKNSFKNLVNESLLDDIKSFISKIRNRLVIKKHKNETDKNH